MSDDIPESIKRDMREQYADGWKPEVIADFYGRELDTVCGVINVDYDEYWKSKRREVHEKARDSERKRENEVAENDDLESQSSEIYANDPIDLEELSDGSNNILENYLQWREECVENTPKEMEERAGELFDVMAQNGVHNNVAAASVCYTCRLLCNKSLSQEEVAQRFDTTEVTLRNHCHNLIKHLGVSR